MLLHADRAPLSGDPPRTEIKRTRLPISSFSSAKSRG
jgi:hypothetical protein